MFKEKLKKVISGLMSIVLLSTSLQISIFAEQFDTNDGKLVDELVVGDSNSLKEAITTYTSNKLEYNEEVQLTDSYQSLECSGNNRVTLSSDIQEISIETMILNGDTIIDAGNGTINIDRIVWNGGTLTTYGNININQKVEMALQRSSGLIVKADSKVKINGGLDMSLTRIDLGEGTNLTVEPLGSLEIIGDVVGYKAGNDGRGYFYPRVTLNGVVSVEGDFIINGEHVYMTEDTGHVYVNGSYKQEIGTMWGDYWAKDCHFTAGSLEVTGDYLYDSIGSNTLEGTHKTIFTGTSKQKVYGIFKNVIVENTSAEGVVFNTLENQGFGGSSVFHAQIWGSLQVASNSVIAGSSTETLLRNPVISFEFWSQPNKLKYLPNTTFDGTGMELRVTYQNGQEESTFGGWTTEYDFSLPYGEKPVTVEFGGKKNVLKVEVAESIDQPTDDKVQWKDHYYQFFDEKITWKEAKQKCEELGGHLATITSKEEQEFITSCSQHNINTKYWLGATDEETEGEWKWVTEEKFEYSNWNRTQPDNKNGVEHYLVLNEKLWNFGWNDSENTNDGLTGYICEWDESKTEENNQEWDDALIELAKKFTITSDISKQLQDIITTSPSEEIRNKRIKDLYLYYSATDIKEGLQYLISTKGNRDAYDFLTQNDIYTAWLYRDYLNNDPKGVAARLSLIASGLVFNSEKDYYLNPWEWVTELPPGVEKYKTMLTEFLEFKNEEDETFEFIKYTFEMINTYASTSIDFDKEILIKELLKSNDKKTIESIAHKAFKTGGKVEVKDTNFAKIIDYSGKGITFLLDASEEVSQFLEMETKISIYQKNYDFLQEIVSEKDLPWEMRLAAQSMINDIENGYLLQLQHFLGKILDLSVEDAIDLGQISEAFGDFSSVLQSIDIGAFLVNQTLVDMSELVKKSAYTEGYAILSEYYADQLQISLEQFANDQTAANAKEFISRYQLLWQLRYKGEEQFLDLNNMQPNINYNPTRELLGIIINNVTNYQDKEQHVKDTLNILLKNRYINDLEEALSGNIYEQKMIVNCPVDVLVYSESGELVAQIKNGEECDFTNEHGRFMSIYYPLSADYTKIIYLNYSNKYNIVLKAVDSGNVRFTYAKGTDLFSSPTMQVQGGNEINILMNQKNSLDIIHRNGEEIQKDTISPTNINEYINVNNIFCKENEIVLNPGEEYLLTPQIVPENATYKDVYWESMSEKIAIVKNGKVIGLEPGETQIKLTSLDNGMEFLCTVRVTGNTPFPDSDNSETNDSGFEENTKQEQISSSTNNSNFKETENDFWDDVISKIKAATGSQKIVVNAKQYTTMPGRVMKALYQNKNVTLVIQWDGGDPIIIPAGKAQNNPLKYMWTLKELSVLYADIHAESADEKDKLTNNEVEELADGALEVDHSKPIPNTGEQKTPDIILFVLVCSAISFILLKKRNK